MNSPSPQVLETLLAGLLVGGWTFAWLTWSFKGDVRAWIAALLFPARWRGDTTRRDLSLFGPERFAKWLTHTASAPYMVLSLFLCHYCMSAHIAAAGTIVAVGLGFATLPEAVFVWAVGATTGLILYESTYRSKPN